MKGRDSHLPAWEVKKKGGKAELMTLALMIHSRLLGKVEASPARCRLIGVRINRALIPFLSPRFFSLPLVPSLSLSLSLFLFLSLYLSPSRFALTRTIPEFLPWPQRGRARFPHRPSQARSANYSSVSTIDCFFRAADVFTVWPNSRYLSSRLRQF